MKELADTPTKNGPPQSLKTASSMEKKAYIQSAFGKLVDLYALGFINDHSQMVGDDDEHLDDP